MCIATDQFNCGVPKFNERYRSDIENVTNLRFLVCSFRTDILLPAIAISQGVQRARMGG
jgi:hypothetical protein